jgi:hypothetical protein
MIRSEVPPELLGRLEHQLPIFLGEAVQLGEQGGGVAAMGLVGLVVQYVVEDVGMKFRPGREQSLALVIAQHGMTVMGIEDQRPFGPGKT